MNQKVTEFEVQTKIDLIKANGIVFYEPLEKNVRIHSYSHRIGERKIQLNVCHGFPEKIETYSFFDWELDDWLKKFSTKKQAKPIYEIPNFDVPIEQYKYSLKMSDKTDNNISGLRSHLFTAIQKLEGGTMKADEAKAMASLAQTIINSAKLELDYKRMIEKTPYIKMLNDDKLSPEKQS